MNIKKNFLSTTRSKIIFCIAGLLFSLIMLLVSTDVNLFDLFRRDKMLDNALREQKKAASALEELEAQQKMFINVSAKFKEITANCWVESRDGLPDIELRRKIEAAARIADLEQINIGSAKRSRLNNDFYFLDIDLNTAGSLDILITFWRELGKAIPTIGWKRVNLRPENSQAADRIFFNGTLRLLGSETVYAAEIAKDEKSTVK